MFDKILKSAILCVLVLLPMKAAAFRPITPFKFDVSVHAAVGRPLRFENILEKTYKPGRYSYYDVSVEELYSRYYKELSEAGTYSVRFESHPLRWLSYGGEIYTTMFSATVSDDIQWKNPSEKHFSAVYFMPEVRFYYFTSKLSTLSGAVSAGLGVYTGLDQSASFDFQVVPLSYTLGNKFYGMVELSLGTVFCGLNFGVGYRF